MLNDAHTHMLLVESGITDAVVQARQYQTVTSKAELKRLGFTDRQARVPALLIPIWTVHGEIGLYHIRPEQPRCVNGKPNKYEFPKGSRMVLDVPPTVRPLVADPSLPVWISEGSKKADALASRGCCVVAVIGVWNWRGKNGQGGTSALADWESIPLKGRTVYIVFDSDVMTKPEVHEALARLRAFLKSKRAKILLVYLPGGPSGKKVGVDDYLVAGHSVDDLIGLSTPHLRQALIEPKGPDIPYKMTAKGLVRLKASDNGSIQVPLTNFKAEIVGDIQEDDGVELHRRFEIEAHLNGQGRRFCIPASQFASMNWVSEHLGAGAVLLPGQGNRDYARAGIQLLSKNVEAKRVYSHTGWRQLDTGEWVFLHAAGAIGQVGQVSGIQVGVSDQLNRCVLPSPPDRDELQTAVKASLRFMDTAPERITIPIYASIWRAVFGASPFAVHLSGQTGFHKTTEAALCQQHFGAELDGSNLPGAWSSTANALEMLCFHAKDVLITVDDFCPIGTMKDQQQAHASADRLVRGQGNQSGRQRLRSDGSLQPEKPPRGLILSTGEDVPKGASLRARLLVIEFNKGDVNLEVVTECQRDAADGLYAQSMAGFLQWLAPHYEGLLKKRPQEIQHLRSNIAANHQHKRTPEIVAHLLYGLWYFLLFAEHIGVLTPEQRHDLYFNRVEKALTNVAADQHQYQVFSDPVTRFLEYLSACLVSGEAHLASSEGTAPSNCEGWGWRLIHVGPNSEYRPQGRRIGWIDGEHVYLEPAVSYAVVQDLGRKNGDLITITSQTLWKRLRDRGLLQSTDQTRETNTVRSTLEGQRRKVLHLHAHTLTQPDSPTVKIT